MLPSDVDKEALQRDAKILHDAMAGLGTDEVRAGCGRFSSSDPE